MPILRKYLKIRKTLKRPDPLTNKKLKPAISEDEMEEKLHGYYVITPDSVYPIKACLSDTTQKHSTYKDIFDACGYHYSACSTCNGDTEPKCGNIDYCRGKFSFQL